MRATSRYFSDSVLQRADGSCFQNRIKILSRGSLPPNQTLEGFYAGESVPVNQALSDVFIKLHITEHTGRGVPRITEAYGKECVRFNENSIVVAVPFERLDPDVYRETGVENRSVIPQVGGSVEDRILEFCLSAKNITEIAEYLGYKDRKTIRKYLNPLIDAGRIAQTIPEKPKSKRQKYITIR